MLKRLKAVPWILVLVAIQVLWDHWHRVEERDRRRVTQILRSSKGLPHRMSQAERREIVEIARRFDHLALGRDLAAAATPFPTPGLKSKKPAKS
ncbi:MAG TPA: hypothetical protein VMT10_02215 [Solirubrobacteraceae bacterium]|nr:hypothetical protein [Solirubrobacteraceae bacterium]